MLKVVATWSGGKESSFACYKAISVGFEVSYLLNMVTAGAKRSMTHGIKIESKSLILEENKKTNN